jgi:hypothetical protein
MQYLNKQIYKTVNNIFVYYKIHVIVKSLEYEYTGHFIMYSGITKIFDRKSIGHVFTKPVQIEGTTQTFFPRKLFFITVHISAAR